MKKFEIGKTYSMHSVCNQEAIWSYTVIARTAQTVTLQSDEGKIQKCRIVKALSEYCNAETVRPLGNYSMCPTLSA